ncbi:MAG: endonuclease [Bacteroidales bacterium]|nr:endonuclease [Lentimicrobiaceae bacterium]MDD5693719.1 endonuclease [Bacteroidales bacterium]
MMNKPTTPKSILFLLVSLPLLFHSLLLAQPSGFYNGTEGKDGQELKTFLHDLIDEHQPFSYFSSKDMMKYADQDPADPDNVLLVYTGTSHPNDDYGTGNNQLNREHVWAKSHGSFTDILPMYSDVHNLKPCDASVNNDKGNKDFDEGGTAHLEAIGCYYTNFTWEPRDSEKGDIARIIFYMAVRYEGDDGEIDLEAVDAVNTSPAPEHGKLSTLLKWNLQDPPDPFEMNRNNVIFAWQKNRNPFIDHPGFAQWIWGGETANPLKISDIQAFPEIPEENSEVIISADISGSSQPVTATLCWGLSRYELNHTLPMEIIAGHYLGEITGQMDNTSIFYRIEASDGTYQTASVTYVIQVRNKYTGVITSISEIQGLQNESPLVNQQVTTTGVVTGTFGEYYYLQQGSEPWSGIRVLDPSRYQHPGDSIIITGTVTETEEVTELHDIIYHYPVKRGMTTPEPVTVTCNAISESYEGMVVTVPKAECTEDDYYSNDWMWTVNDGTGYLKVYNSAICEYQPLEGEQYTVTGPVSYSGSSWFIELRSDRDVLHQVDVTPPAVDLVEVINATTIRIMFSETPDPLSAESESNYAVNKGVSVLDANQQVNMKRNVYLNVTNLQNGSYELTVSNIKDLSGNIMETSIHKFSVTTGINREDHFAHLSVWPDPQGGRILLEWNQTRSVRINYRLTDIRGQLMDSGNTVLEPGTNTLDLHSPDIPKGCYLLIVSLDGYCRTWKMMFIP